MVGRGIFLRRFLTYFESDPTTLSDGMDGKPDTGRKNLQKNAVFWQFDIKLTVLMLRYGLAILIQVEWSSDTLFVKVSRKMDCTKLVF